MKSSAPHPAPLLVISPEDLTALGAKIRAALQPLVEWAHAAVRAIAPLIPMFTELANDPVNIAGLCGRYYVRAGLDPLYRTPEGLSGLVGSIMRGQETDMAFLTVESRAEIAVAAIRSWSDSYATGVPVVAWHRLMGTVCVKVGAAA